MCAGGYRPVLCALLCLLPNLLSQPPIGHQRHFSPRGRAIGVGIAALRECVREWEAMGTPHVRRCEQRCLLAAVGLGGRKSPVVFWLVLLCGTTLQVQIKSFFWFPLVHGPLPTEFTLLVRRFQCSFQQAGFRRAV